MNDSQWIRRVRKVIKTCVGVNEQPNSVLFQHVKHVSVSVLGLPGTGIIHRGDHGTNLCVFEPMAGQDPLETPSERDFAEVFERRMDTPDQLPEFIDQWKSFRTETPFPDPNVVADVFSARLNKTAGAKQSLSPYVSESHQHQLAGDLSKACRSVDIELRITKRLTKSTPEIARTNVHRDLSLISPGLLAWHVPRDDRGQILLKKRIPLFRYDAKSEKRSSSRFCLVLATPDRRSEPSRIELDWLDPNWQSTRMDSALYLIRPDSIESLAKNLLGTPTEKLRAWWDRDLKSRAKAVRLFRAQTTGALDAVLDLSPIPIDERISAVLTGQSVGDMCACCAPLDSQLRSWSAVMADALLRMNLNMILRHATDDERFGGRNRSYPIPVIAFPSQRHNQKVTIGIALEPKGQNNLTILTTASDCRMPIVLWQRPIDLDLLYHGLLCPQDLPTPVARQWAV